MKPRHRLPRPPMNIDHNSPSSSSPSSLVSTLEYQRKQAYLEAAVAAQQQQQTLQHYSQQQNKQIKAVQKSIMTHQRNHDRGINKPYINSNNNNINNNTLLKHQQLQQLLKNNNDNISSINQNHNISAPTKPSPFALACKNWPQGTVSTSQAPPSMPTSLLNLAACSSSNQSQSPNTGSSSSARSRSITSSKISSNTNSIAVTGNMPATRSSSLIKNNNIPRSRNQSSLLQDDLSKTNRLNNASNISVSQKPNVKQQVQAPANRLVSRRGSSRSTIKSDLNQNHLGSQSVTIELVSSSHSSDDRQQSSMSVDPTEKEIDDIALTRVADDSVLQQPISLGNKSRKHVNAYASGILSDSDQLTNEVKSLVLEECNIIYECKSCSNLFRSLPNFVNHKRSFCLMRTAVVEGTGQSRSIASLLSVDSSPKPKAEDKNTSCEEQDGNFSLEPNSVIVDCRPPDHENGDIVTHTYNSRGPGKRYNLAHELRMIRLLHNHDRKAQQQREAAQQKERSLLNTDTIPAETSLSKLLQSQPKARLPASQDKAVIEALTFATATSPTVSSNDHNPINDVKNTTRTQSRKASSILSTKSLMSVEQDNTIRRKPGFEPIETQCIMATKEPQSLIKKISPKRKFLEDCIQKVKRDKRLVEQDDPPHEIQLSSIGSNSNAVLQTTSINGRYDRNDPVEERVNVSTSISDVPSKAESSNNSQMDTDSDDMLTIDLSKIDDTKKKTQQTKSRRRSTNSANSKVSSSSALLKALTRPVLEHNQTVRDIPSVSAAINMANQKIPSIISNTSGKEDSLSQVDIKPICDICNLYFDDSQSLLRHSDAEHVIEKFVYPCILCSMSFILLENACRHIMEIHNKSKDQLIRLKEVVKSRSHLTKDFCECEDYVPSKTIANVSCNDTCSSLSAKTIVDDSIEHLLEVNDPSTTMEKSKEQETFGTESQEPVEQPVTIPVESDSKEVNIDMIVDDIVAQVVDHSTEAEDPATEENATDTSDVSMEVEQNCLSNPKLEQSDKDIDGRVSEADNINIKVESITDQDNQSIPDAYHSQDIHGGQDENPEASKIQTMTSLTEGTEVKDRVVPSDSSSWDKEATESSTDDMCTNLDYSYASEDEISGFESKPHVSQDKRDSRSSHSNHESSSRKHHSKDEMRHSKSHDKNKSRSRSSSTEHVKSEERTHHKSSYNHHNSSAKKKHQSKGEPKISPVPSAEPIMKLKIQLKTRPDEKCKVYEIV